MHRTSPNLLRRVVSIRTISFSFPHHNNNTINRGGVCRALFSSEAASPPSSSSSSSPSPKVDMALLKQLREMTGAPVSDCKKALENSVGEKDIISAACQWLRKVGKAQQAKKLGRPASEGLVGMCVNTDKKWGVLVELNTETDFVAHNARFQCLLGDIVLAASKAQQPPTPTVESVLQANGEINGVRISDQIADCVNSLRENIQIARISTFRAPEDGFVGSYMHQAVTHPRVPSHILLGRIGCLVGVKSTGEGDLEKVQGFAKTVAMHCAASTPKYLNAESVPKEAVEEEKKILREQVIASGKNVDKIETIVTGRLKKFYDDNCLTLQTLLVTEDQTQVKVAAAEAGCELTGFLRFQVGEALS